jgi:hypothetical protein
VPYTGGLVGAATTVGNVTPKSVEIAMFSPRATAMLFGLRGFTAAVVGSFPLSPVCTSFDADVTVRERTAMPSVTTVDRDDVGRVRTFRLIMVISSGKKDLDLSQTNNGLQRPAASRRDSRFRMWVSVARIIGALQ